MEELGLAATLAKGADIDNTLLEYFKNSPKFDMTNNELYNTLNKEAAFNRFVKNDPGLADASLHLLAMAQGAKAFSYLKPRKKDIGQFFIDAADTGVKAREIADREYE